jgi:hypothetical protein
MHGHHPEAHNYRPACARAGLAAPQRPSLVIQKIQLGASRTRSSNTPRAPRRWRRGSDEPVTGVRAYESWVITRQSCGLEELASRCCRALRRPFVSETRPQETVDASKLKVFRLVSYTGTHVQDSEGFTATIAVKRHTRGPPSVFGIDNVDITLSGKSTSTTASCLGTAIQAPGASLQATLIRFAD